jgi:hypothetical protein
MRMTNLVPNSKVQPCRSIGEQKVVDAPHEKECIEEIIKLHNEIFLTAQSLMSKAIRIGELLTLQKQKLPHGEFTRWITENLPFSARTCQNYMRVFRYKDQIENENISVLSDAYNLLKLPRVKIRQNEDDEEKRYFKTFSLYIEEKEILENALSEAKEMLGTDSDSKAIYHISYDWLSMQP